MDHRKQLVFDFSRIFLATAVVSIHPRRHNMIYRQGLTKELGITQNLIGDGSDVDNPGPLLIILNRRLVELKLHTVILKKKNVMCLGVK
jgi:hypothetical protein